MASARAVAAALASVHDLPAAAFGHTRTMNLHSPSVHIGDLVEAVAAAGGLGRVTWEPDLALQTIVDQWPRRLESQRALALGIRGDASIHAIIDHYMNDWLAPR